MALQRKNFRCPPRDGGGASPIHRVAGVGVVVSHAELPPRQRKRLQVGATNLPKTAAGDASDAADPPDALATAARHVCATNIELLKATSGTGSAGSSHRNAIDASESWMSPSKAPVASVEHRWLRSTTPSSSAGRLEDTDSSSAAVTAAATAHATRISASSGFRTTLAHLDAGDRAPQPQLQSRSQSQSLLHDNDARNVSDARRQNDTRGTRDARQRKAHAQSVRHRKRLHEAFVDKYGSMRAVFKAFDRDGDGVISFQRFANMVEASEVGLTPDETRAVYAAVDTNGDNALAFQEFAQMFTASALAGDASKGDATTDTDTDTDDTAGDAIASDPSSSFALKYHSPLELSPRSRERMKVLRGKVTEQLAAQRGLDVSVHGGKSEQLLLYAFKQFDADNDGVLTYEQVRHALGRGFLQLEMRASEMDEMIRLIDRNGDEHISMKEFVQYFGVGKREVPIDLLDNGRTKALAALHQKLNARLTPREEVDPEYFAQRASAVTTAAAGAAAVTGGEDKHACIESTGCLPESLSKRIAAAPAFQTPPCVSVRGSMSRSPSRSSSRVLGGSKSAPTLAALGDPSGNSDGGGINPRDSRDPRGSSRGPEVNPLTSVSQDRFEHRRKERTDWTRVGLGGDGVLRDSGVFLEEHDRFRTTTAEAFSPMRRGQNAGDLFREQPSTSTREFEAHDRTRRARFERTQLQLQQMEVAHAKAERLHDWKVRAIVRATAAQKFAYLNRIHEQEQRVAMKDMQTQKRHGGVRYLRMWAGSPDSQFNARDSVSSIGVGSRSRSHWSDADCSDL